MNTVHPPRLRGRGLAGQMAAAFVPSKISPLTIFGSLLLGLGAILLLPREEEPQIIVPMMDVFVQMPGATAQEVEERVTRPMEQLLWEVPGVEYLYSQSATEQSLVIVRFRVGEDFERAVVRLNQKLQTNFDRIPHGVSAPLIKPRSIDDVPIAALTFHSARHDPLELRRVALQMTDELKLLPQVAEATIIGGARREIRVLLDPVRLASRQLTVNDVAAQLRAANRQSFAPGLVADNATVLLQAGEFLRDADDAGNVVVGVFADRPVRLHEVATLTDGPGEPTSYVLHGTPGAPLEPAVTVSLAKRPGANAIQVVEAIQHRVDELRGRLLPAGMEITYTRDYGHTAAEKSDELLLHMGLAVVGVMVLILFFLGWRESLVVGVAIPTTLALTLLVFLLYGYTLNRITLFALIFSIGILVDDAIVVVENIVRHVHLPRNRGRHLWPVTVEAVGEVGNPTILATLAVIAAILPMAFVGGLMGPYMRPIPVGSSAAMLFSLAIAFTITPWAAARLLHSPKPKDCTPAPEASHAPGHDDLPNDGLTRLYLRVMEPMLARRRWRWTFLVGTVGLLLAAGGMVLIGLVKVKMLPFDNKSELQVLVDLPEGTPLEVTAKVTQELARAVGEDPAVRDFQLNIGTAAPFNFNGLVRHYFLRQQPHLADIQVNLLPKHARSEQSHPVAVRLRPRLAEIAARHGAALVVAEVPPGPPVLQTLVAEIYAPTDEARLGLAIEVKRIFQSTPGVVDVDWYVEAPAQQVIFAVDREKAARHGISVAAISEAVALAAGGASIDLLHLPKEKEDVNIVLRLPPELRSDAEALLALPLRGLPTAEGRVPLVPLRELVTLRETTTSATRHRKNLLPVTYVTADVDDRLAAPAYALLALQPRLAAIDTTPFGGTATGLHFHHLDLPRHGDTPALKWDGEWHITLEVFRDLGLAFAAVLVLIYMLMVGWFRSFLTPLVVMAAIPFSLVGILPAHWAMGAFFTATSMIGFMAGAGIVVRNSIILVDFIELRRRQGLPLAQAVVEAGAVRFRPMLLTALAVVVGASVILADPIFQGLALSLMAGEIASLLLSRFAVPILYFMLKQHEEAHGGGKTPSPTPTAPTVGTAAPSA